MDISNYPSHLTPAELDYELNIRGMFNYATNRLKTLALRERLIKESTGTLTPPKRSDFYNPEDEFHSCEEIIKKVLIDAEGAISTGCIGYVGRCTSRLLHVQARLERIASDDEELQKGIFSVAEGVYEALVKLADVNKNLSTKAAPDKNTQNNKWADRESIESR